MNADMTLLSAFLVGLLGSTHCLGMCGGIVGSLTLGIRPELRRSPWILMPYLLAYNSGRIASYAVAGTVAGAIGAGAFGLMPSSSVRWTVKLFTGGFLIALGLYLAGWWPGLQRLEQWGGVLWKRIEPLGRRLLPVDHPLKALTFGLVWGWLPCGMVYTVLAWSLTSGSALNGALLMIAFGIGTLPMLLAVAGLIVLLFGVYTLMAPGGHGSHLHGQPGENSGQRVHQHGGETHTRTPFLR
jgi:sulfite exporter TauE/SafE